MENVRQHICDIEKLTLSPYATLSQNTKGRLHECEPCQMRSEFQRDRDKILHCKSFRRLKHKTQVFLSPEGDHYRTRLTHTLEVSQIGRTIARALRLNEDLVEAIALGHDLGHTPFGHAGERKLNELVDGGFIHSEQSKRVVDLLENNGKGLNLTFEVRDGIANHRYNGKPATLEGEIVKFADRFAYINHDIEDAIRGGVIANLDLPKDCIATLGESKSKRINNLIFDMVKTSWGKPTVEQSEEFKKATEKLHSFMFERVYTNSKAKSQEAKAVKIIELIFEYYLKNVDKLPRFYQTLLNDYPLDRVVCDYISSFTDRYCLRVFSELFVPDGWTIM
ncbi:MAG: deoxyguanosinetriphosphate triphosphohydrolase [Clostridia bacterium]|nr:deoxyguanosinetriphosphate triphosphohydrolase [Clostridia bacterium]MDE7329357.1 deoxyguanosinetriphosphate triphosphohydrolase [Clostridia bacterium]